MIFAILPLVLDSHVVYALASNTTKMFMAYYSVMVILKLLCHCTCHTGGGVSDLSSI